MRAIRGTRGAPLTDAQAARLAHHTTFGATERDLVLIKRMGAKHWLHAQMARRRETTFDAIGQSEGSAATPRRFPEGLDLTTHSSHPTNGHGAIYAWFATRSRCQLRAKVAHALLQFLVVGNTDVNANNFWNYAGTRGLSRFFDLLHDHAFGNYRTLLEAISRNVGMATWLSHWRNGKATASTQPDENYAREVMQLFSIGLWHLRDDGSRVQPETPTYGLDDVRGLARVFTGMCSGDGNWGKDWSSTSVVEPMAFNATYHETGSKEFLGVTIPPGTSGDASLTIALDTLFNHASCPPFICTRLIQYLVTSNPSREYISRVTATFKDNGRGVRGDLRAVVTAILLDPEALSDSTLASPAFGRMRGSMEHIYGVIRTLGIEPSGRNPISDVVANAGGSGRSVAGVIGEHPGYSPSVFNFFGPAYTPPGAALVAPELQTQTAVTSAGTINELTRLPLGAWKALATAMPGWYALSDAALVDRLSLLLAADQLRPATKAIIVTGITGMANSTDDQKRTRIGTAAGLVLSAAEARVIR